MSRRKGLGLTAAASHGITTLESTGRLPVIAGSSPPSLSSHYEAKAVGLLGIGFRLLALDRWSLATLFPSISKDLHLNYQDLGNLSGILAIAWGVTAIFMGRAADRLGWRKVLLPAIIGFSLMAGFAGLATGFTALYLMRLLMGVFEGAYTPVSIAATTEASKPERRGLNVGIQLGCCTDWRRC